MILEVHFLKIGFFLLRSIHSPLYGVSVQGSEVKTDASFHSALQLFIVTALSTSEVYPISMHFTDIFAQSSVKFS